MFIFKGISDAFNKLRCKLSNQNENSTHRESSEDDYKKSQRVESPARSDRHFQVWQSTDEKRSRSKSDYETPELYRALSSYREENIYSQRVSTVPASQTKPYSSLNTTGTRTSLRPREGLSQVSTTSGPELAPKRADSLPCGCKFDASIVSSSTQRTQRQRTSAAPAPELTSQPWSSLYSGHRLGPPVVSSSRDQSQTRQVLLASASQAKPQPAYSAYDGHTQPQYGVSVAKLPPVQRAYTAAEPQTQLRRSLTSCETSAIDRRSVLTDSERPSPLQATRRSSASELVPEKNRIPQSQLQALNKHMNSYYVKKSNSFNEDDPDLEDEWFAGEQSACSTSGLPYRPDQANVWFQEVIKRDPTAEPEGMPLRARVDMINLVKTNDSRTMLTAIAKFRTIRLEDGDELYFHATDAQSATSILDNGIDVTRTRGREDFSNGYGFYVTPDYTRSTQWACRKGRRLCDGAGAIIAFKVSRQLQKEQPHLFLEVNTEQGRRKWDKTVSHFRNGEAIGAISVLLGNVKFIRGPVSQNAFLRPGEIPVPYEFIQICICDDDYAKRYGTLGNICFVIFFK